MAEGALMDGQLLKLPGQIQLALGSGYAAYLLSYVGISEHHTTVDVTFKSLVFSLVATGVFNGLSQWVTNVYLRGCIAFILCCACGLVWRRYFREPLRKSLRKTDVSWSDDDPSALASILGNSENRMSQLSVLLDDGTWLICKTLYAYENSPFGPCKLGTSGDIAMYVTHIQDKKSLFKKAKERPQKELSNNYWGDNLTYIPSSKIRYVKFRFKKN